MSDLIWQKGKTTIDQRVMAFLAGEDVILDRQLLRFDIIASQAHVNGLAAIGIVSDDEQSALIDGLESLLAQFEEGAFVLDERFEDGHSAIEAFLIERLGDIGKKVHTGRSRNDQVLVATRLFLKDALAQGVSHCRAVAEVCLNRAANEPDLAMPGYTHLQQAVVSSTAMWFAGFAEAFIDNADLLTAAGRWIDANPLGTAAGYGVNIPLDRDLTTELLGFARTQINPIYTQNSRGKYELQVLSGFAQALLDVRRLAWDLSLFTTTEFDFVKLPDQFTTGSSIMPNKRNPDLVELLRGSAAVVQGAINEIHSLLSLPSGYQRDLQFTKAPLLRGVNHALQALALIPDLLKEMRFDGERMAAAITPEMYATDRAMELVEEQIPFREAYRQAMREHGQLAKRTPQASIDARVSPGACADLRLEELRARLTS